MVKLQSPVGTFGRFYAEEHNSFWSQYDGAYCQVVEACFFENGEAELDIRFVDGIMLVVQLHEFDAL